MTTPKDSHHKGSHQSAEQMEQDMGDETSGMPLWAGLTQTVAIDKVPPKGLTLEAEVNLAHLENLKRIFDLQELPTLSASFTIKPLSAGRFSVKGEMSAHVVQSCIVTLEPVASNIYEIFDVQFWPEEDLIAAETTERTSGKQKEIEVDPFNENEPEWIEHGKLHLGRFLFELFSTSLEPYPRKAGAAFEWEEDSKVEEENKVHPFAVLKTLQKKNQNDEK